MRLQMNAATVVAVNLRVDHRIEIADPEDDIFDDGHEFPIATIGFTC